MFNASRNLFFSQVSEVHLGPINFKADLTLTLIVVVIRKYGILKLNNNFFKLTILKGKVLSYILSLS